MSDLGTYVWLLITACAFVVGYLVGKKHGARVANAAKTLRDTVDKL